jgi:hypothetical protein
MAGGEKWRRESTDNRQVNPIDVKMNDIKFMSCFGHGI